MQNTIVTISSPTSSDFAHRLARETSLFMQTMQALTLLENVALSVLKMGCGLPHTRPPDLAQSDFFLFGYVKDRLQGIVFASREELLAGISEVLDELPPENLPRVFEHWIERLEWLKNINNFQN